jgi:uncharacterized protein with PIN domain
VRIQAYVTREEYERIREFASSVGMSVSELVKRAITDIERLEEEVFEKGCETAERLIERDGPYLYLGIEEFAIPCPRCGEPILFTSKDEQFWREEVKPRLIKAFSDHVCWRCKQE